MCEQIKGESVKCVKTLNNIKMKRQRKIQGEIAKKKKKKGTLYGRLYYGTCKSNIKKPYCVN